MKIPIIRKGEYDIWSMRMRQYICHTDHNLWDVIVNGDLEEEPAPTGETSAPPAPKTAKQLAAKRNQERVKSILLLAILDEYLLKVYEDEMKRSLSSTSTSQNLTFLSSKNHRSTNEVSTAIWRFWVKVSASGINWFRIWHTLNEMSNNSKTDSEISLSVFDVRSSDEESTPANDRFSKADGYHAVPPPITRTFLTPRADISFAMFR
ncbi:hypothetical protein Tco_1097121 [Tanacetum coccineum]